MRVSFTDAVAHVDEHGLRLLKHGRSLHARNLAKLADKKIDLKLPFTDAAVRELHEINEELNRMFADVTASLESGDMEAAKSALVREGTINDMRRRFRDSHLERLRGGLCHPHSGMVFLDCLYNFERMGDHLTNISQAALSHFQWGRKYPRPKKKEAEQELEAAAAPAQDGAEDQRTD